MRLTAGCWPADTYSRCYFVLAGKLCFAKEVAVAGATVVEAPALRAHVPIDEDVLLHVAVLSGLLFPARFAAA
jgi:hypothetical protein